MEFTVDRLQPTDCSLEPRGELVSLPIKLKKAHYLEERGAVLMTTLTPPLSAHSRAVHSTVVQCMHITLHNSSCC